jgi:hypothetical protein
MNDFHLAALGFGAAAGVFITAALRSGREREHRVWMAVGCALLAVMFGLVFYDLGSIVQRIQEGFEQFGSDLGEVPSP